MDISEGMKNKNDYSQLTDEEREALKKHQEENKPEEEGAGADDIFKAVTSDIVGLAQTANAFFDNKNAGKILQDEMTKTSDDLYTATATTQGQDPYQTGMDTIYQDVNYGTNTAKYGEELMEEDVLDIDEELYRKLIAAGADIEIL
jgi:hypothetical protein